MLLCYVLQSESANKNSKTQKWTTNAVLYSPGKLSQAKPLLGKEELKVAFRPRKKKKANFLNKATKSPGNDCSEKAHNPFHLLLCTAHISSCMNNTIRPEKLAACLPSLYSETEAKYMVLCLLLSIEMEYRPHGQTVTSHMNSTAASCCSPDL